MDIDKTKEYTWKELCKIFDWSPSSRSIEDNIKRAKKKGVDIVFTKRNGELGGVPALYKILQCNIYDKEWVKCPLYPQYEVTKDGDCRQTDNKTLCGYVNKKTGYVIVTDKRDRTALRVHRLIMMTFCPIDNPDDYVVDHINGIRNDNRLENLRWVTQEENLQKRDSNRANIQNNLLKIIQKYGYEETNKILLRVLNEEEN